MLFRVWANCSGRRKKIEEIDQRDLDEAVNEVFDDAMENDMIDIFRDNDPNETDYTKMKKAFDKIWDWWEDTQFLYVGDYMIVEKDSIDEVHIPDMCGYNTSIIFADDIKYMADRRWYAVLTNREDKDLSYGSYNKEEAFRDCKKMNDRYEEEGKPREAYIAEIDNYYDPVCTGKYSDEEVIDYLNYVEVNKKEEANKSVNNMEQTEKEDEEEI